MSKNDCANNGCIFLENLLCSNVFSSTTRSKPAKARGSPDVGDAWGAAGCSYKLAPIFRSSITAMGDHFTKGPMLDHDTNGKPLYILTYGNSLRLIHLLSVCTCTQLPVSGWQFLFVLPYISSMEINGTQKEILDCSESSFGFSCKILLKTQMNFWAKRV